MIMFFLPFSKMKNRIILLYKEHYPDPTDEMKKFVVVDVKAIRKLKNPVSLKRIKDNKNLANIALIKQSRLSVMPLKKSEWQTILKMSEEDG